MNHTIMTDIQTPPSAATPTNHAGASSTEKSIRPRVEQPDEQQYKKSIEAAEAELKIAQEKLVC